ncbi:hypothetical protein IM511_09730 [Erythrobacteraceae bacterium E2-1 Yellow Sea]|nr:hypothetical protein [Erythrobacteraceae bacterium E2-1 Yellow Sea]
MNEASFASLCPTLLARKGGAKPAMRPQLGVIPANQPDGLEDLGWNDMGDDDTTAGTSAAVIPLNLAVANADDENHASNANQFDNLARRLAQPARKKIQAVVEEATAKPAAIRKGSSKNGKRAAFTLRLDAERHLKLRLAATMQSCSAQQLVTDALDLLLAEFEDLDSLAARLSRS